MIDCISAACCIQREHSEKIVILAPPVIWTFCSVFLASISVRAYTNSNFSLETLGYSTEFTYFFLFVGVTSIFSVIFTLSNLIQVILEVSSGKYALQLQEYGQYFFISLLGTLWISEFIVISLSEPLEIQSEIDQHLLKSGISIGVLLPFTLISYLYREREY